MEANEKKSACEKITNDILLEYSAGGLEEALRRGVESHLGRCESCRRRAEEVSLITSALKESARESGDVPVPERVDKAVFATIEEVSGKRVRSLRIARTLRYLIPAAACILVVLFVWLLLSSVQYKLARSERESAAYAPVALPERQAEPALEQPLAAPAAVLVQELKEQIENEKEKSKRYAEELAGANAEIEQLNAKASSLQAELAAEKQKTSTLTAELKKREKDAKELEEALAQDILRLKNEVTEALAKVGKLSEEIRKSRESYAREAAERAQLQAEYEALKKKMIVRGDLNGDKKADVLDALIIADKLLSENEIAYSSEGDLNEDGIVDVGDALLILNNALAE